VFVDEGMREVLDKDWVEKRVGCRSHEVASRAGRGGIFD
jgi:hypothetical protein